MELPGGLLHEYSADEPAPLRSRWGSHVRGFPLENYRTSTRATAWPGRNVERQTRDKRPEADRVGLTHGWPPDFDVMLLTPRREQYVAPAPDVGIMFLTLALARETRSCGC